MKTRQQKLADYIRFVDILRTRMAHHSGLMPIPFWLHIKAHYKLWRIGHGTTIKHILEHWKYSRHAKNKKK